LGPVEAIACGTPVIVSDIPAMREILPEAERFNPTSHIDLGIKIMNFLENKKRRDFKKMRKVIREKFSLSKMVKSYIQIFEQLAKK